MIYVTVACLLHACGVSEAACPKLTKALVKVSLKIQIKLKIPSVFNDLVGLCLKQIDVLRLNNWPMVISRL